MRFVKSVTETETRLNLKHPTLFAWHGSALHNWHSIIREGLHFDQTVNGRAYGE
jgi:ubiquitin-conjugating enzyme E2 Q